MPRRNAAHYDVIGAEILASEAKLLESIARHRGLNRSEMLRILIRDFLSSDEGLSYIKEPKQEDSSHE